MIVERTETDKEVRIERVFNAPRELVFKAWTDPECLERWYAPRGCSIEIRRMEVREGGRLHTCIHTDGIGDCWVKGVYLEVAVPERIKYTMSLSDEYGGEPSESNTGKDPDWPSETTVTVTFEEQDAKTLVTLHQTVSESIARRTGAYPSWIQMMDRLEEQLAATH